MPRQRAKRVAILTGGGDCPGLNAVIRAVSRTAFNRGWHDPPDVRAVPLAEAVGQGKLRKVPLDSDILRSARDIGIGFGD